MAVDVRIPLTDLQIGDREVDAVTAVLRSGWLTSGRQTKLFEQRFATMLGTPYAHAVSSCAAALHLAYEALEVGEGDEVICPDLTFVATANAVRYTGARPVFARPASDDDLNLDPAHVEALVSPRTRAICVVHYAGFACDMTAILQIAERYGLRVVEDCAHAPFARANLTDGTRALGTISDIGCFSFFGTKNISTGEGGMVVTADAEFSALVDRLRTHGITVPTFERHRKKVLGYDVEGLGFNYRFDDIRAALGLAQLERVHSINAKRRQLVARYRRLLSEVAGVKVPFSERDLENSACHLMPVLVDADPVAVRARLRKVGIQTSKHYEPVSSLALYGARTETSTVALARRLMTLPLGPHMSGEDVDTVVAALREAIRNIGGRAKSAA